MTNLFFFLLSISLHHMCISVHFSFESAYVLFSRCLVCLRITYILLFSIAPLVSIDPSVMGANSVAHGALLHCGTYDVSLTFTVCSLI